MDGVAAVSPGGLRRSARRSGWFPDSQEKSAQVSAAVWPMVLITVESARSEGWFRKSDPDRGRVDEAIILVT